MQNMRKYEEKRCSKGFTIIEIMIVVVILSIAALMAIPTITSAADMQVRSAANQIAAHLDYAKNMAITHQRAYAVVFDPAGESYEVYTDRTGDNVVDVVVDAPSIDHPVNPGSFVVDFSTDRSLKRVDIDTAIFDPDSSDTITFDYLGSPYSGNTTDPAKSLNSGQITLQAGDFTLTVDVEPVTGYVTMSAL